MPPRFSIVVPTRERSDTLRHSLRTCVEQSYGDLEIIVSDNASCDGTRAVVESIRDSRIKYVNPGNRIGMSRNWEFGLSHVTGDFVTFVGDDDGLLPEAISDVAGLIARHAAPAVAWEKVQYSWPGHPLPGFADVASIPLANRLFICEAKAFAKDCAALWTPSTRGPCLYNAFVSVPVIRSVQARTAGIFFHSVIPDTYSSLAIASGVSNYYYSSRPFSINGASRHSNGANTDAFLRDEGDSANATRRFVEETDLPLHREMPILILGSSVAVSLEPLLQANDHCYGGALRVDIDAALPKIVKEVSCSQSARYNSVRAQLLDLTKNDLRRHRIVEAALERYPNRPRAINPPSPGLGNDHVFTTSLAAAGVEDVHGAARFVHQLLGPYSPPSRIARYSHYSKVLSRAVGAGLRRLDPFLW